MSGDEVRNNAYEDYLTGMKYKEIAEKYNVSLSAVKSWAVRYWKNGCNQEKKKLQPKDKKVATSKVNKQAVVEEVDQVLQNPELTDRQQLFCLYYVRCFNATKAYQKAYGSRYETAIVEGCKLLRNPKVKAEILALKQDRLNREFLREEDIFQKYMDIAFADMHDFVEVEGSYVSVKKEFDGSIVSEVSETQNGIKIKLADRMKALQWLADHMDLATEKQRAEIALLRTKAEDGSDVAVEDDGFLDALNGTAAEDWADEED